MLVTSCGPGPVTVLTGLEIVVAEGDEQFGTVGQPLGTPLRAVVRSEATQVPQEDVSVRWEVQQGGATLVGSANATTDSTGSVEIRVQFGAMPEDVLVRATVTEQPSAWATFALHSVEPPILTDVSPGAGAAGDTVTITGSNFSPDPIQNVVLFSGVRGRVVSATGTQLEVEVPRCLPARAVAVRTQLGAVASDSVTFTVTGGGEVTALLVGQVIDVVDDGGFDCYTLAGGTGVKYLGLVYSASTVAAAMHPFELTALSSSAPGSAPAARPVGVLPASSHERVGDPQILWDERLRTMEGELLVTGRHSAAAGAALAERPPAAVPSVGESRVFNVLNLDGSYDQATAVARYVGTEAAIFVDQDAPDAPAGGFTSTDLEAFAARFDDVIQPEVTDVFGAASDLDGNERVIILFTPQVNELTPRGSAGFIGGFFFGTDLLPGSNANSNGAEVFYALVPDPTGEFSNPRSKDQVLDVVPAVLAHEFQHMVHFNQRFLGLEGGQEALWLSEALAQMAEELVARRYDELVDPTSAELFRSGARTRSGRYLAGTDSVSLIVSTGQGTLAERGAGFLHLLYLADQEGTDLLGRLTRTTRTGVSNVVTEVGREWPGLLADWWSAIYLDGSGPETGPLVYPNVHLRAFLGGNQFPLYTVPVGPGSLTPRGLLWSSSAAYYIVSPDPGGSMTIRLGGEAGGASAPQAALRLRIIRVP